MGRGSASVPTRALLACIPLFKPLPYNWTLHSGIPSSHQNASSEKPSRLLLSGQSYPWLVASFSELFKCLLPTTPSVSFLVSYTVVAHPYLP